MDLRCHCWRVALIPLFFIGRYSMGTKSPVASPSQSAAKSIAVLPFANLSADKNDEYLSDGMTEELLNVLTKVKSLHVPGAVRPSLLRARMRTTSSVKSANNFT